MLTPSYRSHPLDQPVVTDLAEGLPQAVGQGFEGANELQHWIVARHLIGRDITG